MNTAPPRRPPGQQRQQGQRSDVEERIDGHLEQRAPQSVQLEQQQRQHAREEDPVFVVGGEQVRQVQLAPKVGIEQVSRLGVPLVPEGDGVGVGGDDPELDGDQDQHERESRGTARENLCAACSPPMSGEWPTVDPCRRLRGLTRTNLPARGGMLNDFHGIGHCRYRCGLDIRMTLAMRPP